MQECCGNAGNAMLSVSLIQDMNDIVVNAW